MPTCRMNITRTGIQKTLLGAGLHNRCKKLLERRSGKGQRLRHDLHAALPPSFALTASTSGVIDDGGNGETLLTFTSHKT